MRNCLSVISRVLVIVMLMTTVFSCTSISNVQAYSDSVGLNGTWQFYPDVEENIRVIKYDGGGTNHSTVIGYYNGDGKTYMEKMVLNVPDVTQMQYAKVMAYIHVGNSLAKMAGETGYYLKVKTDIGSWQYVDLSPYMDNQNHWIEIPVNNSDFITGENGIWISSSISNTGNLTSQSVDLFATSATNANRARYSVDNGATWPLLTDRQWNVRLHYSSLSNAVWQNISVPSVWEGNFNYTNVKDKFLKVKVNNNEWVSKDISDIMDNGNHWVEIPIPLSYLVNGGNVIMVDSTIKNTANMVPGSVDILASNNTPSGYSSYSNDLKEWIPLPDRNLNIRLSVYNSRYSRWDEIYYDNGGTAYNTVVGLYAPSNTPYYEGVTLPLNYLADVTQAKVKVNVHVGNAITYHSSDSRKFDGVGWYKKDITIPALGANQVKWLCFDAVDYNAEVWLNNKFIGSHEGGYTPFKIDLSSLNGIINYGGTNTLVVRVTDQYDTRTHGGTGKFPIKETPAGFAHDSVGVNYGGIWQNVSMKTSSNVNIERVFMNPDIDNNRVQAKILVSNKSTVSKTLTVQSSVAPKSGGTAYTGSTSVTIGPGLSSEVSFYVNITSPTLWSANNPFLYTSTVSVKEGATTLETNATDFGMRKVSVSGHKIRINNQNVFLTGQLHWGMYLNGPIAQWPTVAQVEKEIADLKAAGFNSVKFCLLDVPDYILDEFDHHGMYVNIEYPIWFPTETAGFYARARQQITEMVIKDRNHPSVIMSDFNCEMQTISSGMASVLQDLFYMGKSLAPNRLYLDNDGQGPEVNCDYNGIHPYMPINLFGDNLQAFINSRVAESGDKPIVAGEYADTDSIRDTTAIRNANGGTLPWWWTMLGTVDPETKLASEGFNTTQINTLKQTSVNYAQMAKKHYMEETKKSQRMAGLYLTHISDIPQTQAGFYDDTNTTRFNAGELKKSANETVLLLSRQTQNFWSGASKSVTPMISHYDGTTISNGTVTWAIKDGTATVSSGTSQTGLNLSSGEVYNLSNVSFTVPTVSSPKKYSLQITLAANNGTYTKTNDWNIWVYPNDPIQNPNKTVQVYDPSGSLGLTSRYTWMTAWNNSTPGNPYLLITTAWTSNINTYLNNGGRVIFLGNSGGPIPVTRYSTEAFILNKHAALGQFPNDGYNDMQFFELNSPYYMDYRAFYNNQDLDQRQPIIGFMNLRNYNTGSFMSEFSIGSGSLLQSTLRFHSNAVLDGLPAGWQYAYENVAGKYLLDQMLRYKLGLVVSGNIAPEAKLVEVSSQGSSTYRADWTIDGIKGVQGSSEWASNAEQLPWIKLTWSQGITIGTVKLYDRPNTSDNIQSGTLSFSDGSTISVSALDNAGAAKVLTFTPKTGITWVKFKVDSSNAGWQNNGLSEIEVFAN